MHATRSVLVIVAHPDDETLWAGGTLLDHPGWNCFVACICRGSDPDRAPRFFAALRLFGATGAIDDLDDGPEQTPLRQEVLIHHLLSLIPQQHFDLLITHHPKGEYTRHKRHEEVSKAVINCWQEGRIQASELWMFAYEDGHGAYYPQADSQAPLQAPLSPATWQRKYQLITVTYGFAPGSWEAATTPATEAFWRFTDPSAACRYLQQGSTLL
ncbi:PIG-L deacetylase family protein [Chitinophaga vietnamensis]|uniref:PIG-L deacetylase family protein n=1 Tax=Chitinophaga vietnamensis TaxID=2593957 RepID=UPI00117759EF|nr:PIG-L family deacetylase [Chitinophaga vietnamensis]